MLTCKLNLHPQKDGRSKNTKCFPSEVLENEEFKMTLKSNIQTDLHKMINTTNKPLDLPTICQTLINMGKCPIEILYTITSTAIKLATHTKAKQKAVLISEQEEIHTQIRSYEQVYSHLNAEQISQYQKLVDKYRQINTIQEQKIAAARNIKWQNLGYRATKYFLSKQNKK